LSKWSTEHDQSENNVVTIKQLRLARGPSKNSSGDIHMTSNKKQHTTYIYLAVVQTSEFISDH
jgi:hypothetical protein